MPPLPILTELRDRAHFAEVLQKNPGLFIVKFGAEWCGPCKKIEGLVHEWFEQTNEKVQCAVIDVDEAFDVYAFLKSKKMVNGIPAILCYEKGNVNYVPNDVVIGADPEQVGLFFKRCLQKVM
jgi:thioredoxin 1